MLLNLSRPKNQNSPDTDDENYVEFPTIDEAAMMAVGIPLTRAKELTEEHSESQVILPHDLPRAAYVPPAPHTSIEPLYQPVNGQPTGKLLCLVLYTVT